MLLVFFLAFQLVYLSKIVEFEVILKFIIILTYSKVFLLIVGLNVQLLSSDLSFSSFLFLMSISFLLFIILFYVIKIYTKL
jgi:hypothetical protein